LFGGFPIPFHAEFEEVNLRCYGRKAAMIEQELFSSLRLCREE